LGKEIAAVIFDMDGLMFDTERIAVKTFVEAAERLEMPIPAEYIVGIVGMDHRRADAYISERMGGHYPLHEVGRLADEIRADYIRERGLPVKEGLFELLDFLKKIGLKCAVATSTHRPIAEENLKIAGVIDRFDTVVCGDDITNGKPDPDIFLLAAGRLAVPPERCMVLEDSQAGLTGAARAGMMPVLIPDIKDPYEDVKDIIFTRLPSLHEVIGLIGELKRGGES